MHTIGDLRKALDLATDNQVRNRIDAIKDLLYPYLRRGPNNQILVADQGLSLLRELQELYDSGLTITQASSIMETKSSSHASTASNASSGFAVNGTKHTQTDVVIDLLKQEVGFLRERVKYLEQRQSVEGLERKTSNWWEKIREDVDGA